MEALKKALISICDLMQTNEYWHLPVDITTELSEAKKVIVTELESELESLKFIASRTFEEGNNRYISGDKPAKIKRLMKTSKKHDEMAEELEEFLAKYK